ncbi:N-acetylmuramoyl-L-alanine amidase family protein [Paenibacillus sp. MBLB4367]|uniref:peptidoglycan recognition protein family protein n=1 Tax=Paenibacillus sp. MBLB4367 TaxID=3384767 RepID=UPI003907FBB3
MGLYPVNSVWVTGLPKIAYRLGVGKWEGVVMHYTDNSNSTAWNERAYMATNYDNAFVHEFIDPNVILQVADPHYLAYGAGSPANQRFVHLELCVAKSQSDFDKSFDMWCQRAAFFLSERKLPVDSASSDGSGTLWAHADVTRWLGGTTHMDPIAYLNKWGKSWQDAVDTVQRHYDLITGVEEAMLKPEDANKLIDTFLSPLWYFVGSDEDKEEIHRLANELRKASGQPEQ